MFQSSSRECSADLSTLTTSLRTTSMELREPMRQSMPFILESACAPSSTINAGSAMGPKTRGRLLSGGSFLKQPTTTHYITTTFLLSASFSQMIVLQNDDISIEKRSEIPNS